MIEFN